MDERVSTSHKGRFERREEKDRQHRRRRRVITIKQSTSETTIQTTTTRRKATAAVPGGGQMDDDEDAKPLAVRLSEKKQKEVLMIDDDEEEDDKMDADDAKEKNKENADNKTTNKRKIPAAFVGASVPKSKMPLLINHGALQKTANSTILFECKGSGEAVDLSGDVGVVGRLLVEREAQPTEVEEVKRPRRNNNRTPRSKSI